MPRRRKRIFLFATILFVVVVAGFGVWYLTRVDDTVTVPEPSTISISRETTYVLGPVDQFGYVDYAEVIDREYREGVTPENNAAVLFWKAFGPTDIPESIRTEFFRRLGIPRLPDRGNYLSLTDREIKTLFEVIKRPWKTAEFPETAAWLNRNERPLRVLVEATKRSRYYSPMLATRWLQGRQAAMSLLMEDTEKARIAARILLTRALWHIGENRFDEARADIRAGHRLARLIDQNPTTIGGLAAIAVDAVVFNADFALAQSNRLTVDQLRECTMETRRLTEIASGAAHLDRCDRLVILDCATLVARNGWEGLDLIADANARRRVLDRYAERHILSLTDWDVVLRAINQHFDRAIAIGRIVDRADRRAELDAFRNELLELRARRRGFSELSRDAVTRWFADWAVAELCPPFGQVWTAEDQNHVRTRLAETAYALAAFRLHTGRYPKDLSEVVPRYLMVVPTDPHSGLPLIYSCTDAGYRLGSFGENGRDDEGRGPSDDPPGDDVFIKTPNKRNDSL